MFGKIKHWNEYKIFEKKKSITKSLNAKQKNEVQNIEMKVWENKYVECLLLLFCTIVVLQCIKQARCSN